MDFRKIKWLQETPLMKLRKQDSLKHFIYVVLTRRILLVTLLFSLALSAIVHISVNNSLYEHVFITAHDRFETLRARTNEYRENDGVSLQQAVDLAINALSAIQYDKSIGNFVHYQINSLSEGILVDRYDNDYPYIDKVKQHIADTQFQFSEDTGTLHEIIKFDDRSYVHLIMPLYNKTGDLIGHLRAMFALTQATMDRLKNEVYATIFYAVLIVILTTAILYPVIIHLTRRLVAFSIDLLDSNIETLQVLGNAIAKRDSDTNSHNYRVTIIATRLAEKINLPDQQIESLIKGAFLHDVGKIGISDNILLKPGKLTESEFTLMKTHVEKGLEIIKRSKWLTDAKDVVGGHHEKYDGSGYPHNLKSNQIPINARIFAISDVFDALTSKRPYKKAFTFEETMKIIIEKSGSHFDPELIKHFTLIAAELYQELSDKNDEALRKILNDIIQEYFSTGIDSLSY
ncbi:hypothetical protein W03_12500 [Nitrosomonas sp. PY1]|uniref:HD-GYP domain-containing protein n=1 Tax=Nitrosomonas sp. PY1 TaxID=1803906 RepID=UPI001FC8B33A|nr:HD-GYP domain-containing protein [Nitrosomonas sp. PY1]GKS69246.1 hypothetical protein W03_12500 [Nitrosomonas sp. PY1]